MRECINCYFRKLSVTDQPCFECDDFSRWSSFEDSFEQDTYHAKKHDRGKLRYSLLVWPFVRGIVQVLEFGAEKYSANSWQTLPDGETRYRDAAIRHIMDAETDNDEESGLDHLFHAGCNFMFLWWLRKNK